MTTSLYFPMIGFTMDGQDGNAALLEHLIQSGPAFELVVHESPSWLKIKDELPRKDIIKIISEKESNQYKEKVNNFFSPFHKKYPDYILDENKLPTQNLTLDCARAWWLFPQSASV